MARMQQSNCSIVRFYFILPLIIKHAKSKQNNGKSVHLVDKSFINSVWIECMKASLLRAAYQYFVDCFQWFLDAS
jgi:hypothetical protein